MPVAYDANKFTGRRLRNITVEIEPSLVSFDRDADTIDSWSSAGYAISNNERISIEGRIVGIEGEPVAGHYTCRFTTQQIGKHGLADTIFDILFATKDRARKAVARLRKRTTTKTTTETTVEEYEGEC